MSATPSPPSGLRNSANWRRSSYSTGMNNCVETAGPAGGVLAVRDSKRAGGPALHFTATAWQGFLSYVRADPPGSGS
ncbi:DUF397 domain-containing protein [Streptomyces sp. NPDC101132]|uniref:DUF397 domain-containing protein n=1 Tax=Streptomyces sp. NPDC101132 TaxID=3366110 RepID=UPI00381022B2